MAPGRLAKRRCAQFGRPASSTFEPNHANASSSLARRLRTEPCTGTFRPAFYSREQLSWRGDLPNHLLMKKDRRGVGGPAVLPDERSDLARQISAHREGNVGKGESVPSSGQ